MPRTVSSPRACALLDISYRQLDYWTRTGLLRPIHALSGSGSRRGFGRRDIIVGSVIAELRRAGAPHDLSAEVAERLYTQPDEPTGTLMVTSIGEVVSPWSVLDVESIDLPAWIVRVIDRISLADAGLVPEPVSVDA